MAVLNLLVFAVALSEFYWGLEVFLPRNPATEIMYQSRDLVGFSEHRVPATFVAAAAYGNTMVASMPFLVGRWQVPGVRTGEKALLVAGLFAAALGPFLCGSRSPVICLFALGALVVYQLRARLGYLIPVGLVVAAVTFFVTGSERLQRFLTLQDTEMVATRLQGSANVGIVQTLLQYPMGAGLASAWGTSIPSFLSHLAVEPIGAENEWARISVEQGFVGLLLWAGFVGWLLLRPKVWPSRAWVAGGQLMLLSTVLFWLSACFGTGLLSAVPGTALLFLQMGLLARTLPLPPTGRLP
jgi:hypothetical protein